MTDSNRDQAHGRATPHADATAQRLTALEAEVAALRARLEASSPWSAPPTSIPSGAPGSGAAPEHRTDRRRLLQGAGLAAVAGATAALSASAPADAANGAPMVLGETNSATSLTLLLCDATPSNPAAYPFALNVLPQDNETGGLFLGRGQAPLCLATSGPPPRDDGVPQLAGSIVSDENQDLWFAVTSGLAADWRKITGPGVAGALHVLDAPQRVYDSRPGEGPSVGTKGKLTQGEERLVSAAYLAPGPVTVGVPTSTRAALVNVTAVETSAAGWFALFKNGVAWGGTSSLNWSTANQNVANLAVVALDTSRRFRIRCAGSAHALVDVVGYYL